MEVRPVRSSKKPIYPAIEIFENNPRILMESIPSRWLNNGVVAGALASFILGGCSSSRIDSVGTAQFGPVSLLASCSRPDGQHANQESVKVAPVFVHGDGSGAEGCVVVAPPVFISEEEAREIILDEFKKESLGLAFNEEKEIAFSSRQIAISCISDKELDDYPEIDVTIGFDGYDKKKNLAYEYVSVKDYQKFADEKNLNYCSVTEFETKKAAEIIRDEMKKKGETNGVVFYDPITIFGRDWNDTTHIDEPYDWEKGEKMAKEEAKKLLVAQVHDFIQWLKKEKLLGNQ
jgi:hypothetical protein